MLCLLWLISTTAHGQNFFRSGNLYYYITDNTNNTVRVTKPDGMSKYTGNVTIPATVTYSGVTYSVTAIEAQAFHSCDGLSSITIGSNVTEIGSQAFWGCTLLTSITIGPNVTEIGSEAFRGCTKLTSMTIPDNVTKIGGQAFLGCTKLTSVTIGKGVTTIGSDAFYDCSELNEIICYAESAPTCVGSPGVSSNCTLYVPANGTGYDVAPWSNFTNIQNVVFYNDDDPIKYSFDNNAKTATITDGKSCSGAVVIPEKVMKDGVVYTVTAIGKDAFNGSRITSINIPKSITSIGSDAFISCSMLDKVIVSDLAAWFNVSFDKMYSQPMYYATHLYSDENTEITELVIPEGVTKIPDYALYRCTNLTSVTFPNSLVSFSSFVFLGCSKLTSLTIPNGVESIGNSTFQDCSGLVTVTIGSGVKTIYPYAFNHCSNIKEIVSLATTAPGCMTDAFNQVPTSCILYVPQGSTGYDVEPWSNFTLKEMVGEKAPVCVDGIWYNRDTEDMTATVVAMPNGEKYSGEITIPETVIYNNVEYKVTTIADDAFSGCNGVTAITSLAQEPPTCGSNAFADVNKETCTLYVPQGYVGKYKSADGWKAFASIEEIGYKEALAEAQKALEEARETYETYVSEFDNETYKKVQDLQKNNQDVADKLLTDIEMLEKKLSESNLTEEDKASYLEVLEKLEEDISALNEKNEAAFASNKFKAKMEDFAKAIESRQSNLTAYENMLNSDDITIKMLEELLSKIKYDMESATALYEEVKAECEAVEAAEASLATIAEGLAELAEQLKECSVEVDAAIENAGEDLTEAKAKAEAALKAAKTVEYTDIAATLATLEARLEALTEEASSIMPNAEISDALQAASDEMKSLKAQFPSDQDMSAMSDYFAAYHAALDGYAKQINDAATADELEAITNKISQAKAEAEALLKSIAGISEALGQLSDKIYDISSAVDDTIEVAAFEEARREAEAALAAAQSVELADVASTAAELEAELETLTEKASGIMPNAEISEALQSMSDEIERLKEQLPTDETVSEIADYLAEYDKKLAEYEAEMDNASTSYEMNRLTEQIEEAKAAAEAKVKAVDDLNKALAALAKQMKACDTAIDEAQQALEETQEKAEEVIAAAQEACDEYMAALDDETCQQVEENQEANQTVAEGLLDDIAALEKALAESGLTAEESAEYGKTLADIKSAVEELQDKNDQAYTSGQFEEEKKALEDYQAELDDMAANSSTASQDELNALIEKVEAIAKAIEDGQATLADVSKTLQDIADELSDLKTALDECAAKIKETTAVKNVPGSAADSIIYTVGGVRIKTPGKGLYIKNGRKVVVK